MQWSEPVPFDLTRTNRRVSVPKSFASKVPKLPGVYVIIRADKTAVQERILDVGMAGPRNGKGLRGRIASCVAHSACQRIAEAISENVLTDTLKVIWLAADSDQRAKQLEGAILALFREEFSRLPLYNSNGGSTTHFEMYSPNYDALKQHVMSL